MCAYSQSKPRMAALQLGDTMNYRLDHLIPLCDLFNIPLLLDSARVYNLAIQYYTPIKLILIGRLECVAYISNFDLFFVSEKYMALSLQATCRLLFGKKIEFFYCPHGNSDKGFIDLTMNQLTFHKLSLIYGEQMRQRIHEMGLSSQIHALVTMGNIRKRFYRKHEFFFNSIIKRTISFASKAIRHVFLYAPSWQDTEHSTSFFTICKSLIEHISPSDYLIIKIHPLLLTHNLGYVTHICENYKLKKNIQFITDNPLIYPLLEQIDIYLGDISSIGYDFLFFNRPMFFFDTRINPPSQSKSLFQCGIEVPLQYFKNPYPFIFSTLSENRKKSMIREKMYNYVFAEDPLDNELKQNILDSYHSLKLHKQTNKLDRINW